MILEQKGDPIPMAREFTLVPQDVKKINTKYRRIQTKLPVPESIPILEKLYEFEPRARLVEKLVSILPEPLKKVFLYSIGSEAVECALKMCRTYGIKSGGRSKHVIVSYDKAFHGRTLGAQQAGGIPELKQWIVNLDPGFVQAPFPDGFRTPDTSFDSFERSLREQGIEPQNVAGVILETYQGGSSAFAPVPYMKS